MDMVLQNRYGVRLTLIDPFGWMTYLSAVNSDNIALLHTYVDDSTDYTISGDGHPNA